MTRIFETYNLASFAVIVERFEVFGRFIGDYYCDRNSASAFSLFVCPKKHRYHCAVGRFAISSESWPRTPRRWNPRATFGQKVNLS